MSAKPSKIRPKICTINTLAADALLENLRRGRTQPLEITPRMSSQRADDLERDVRLGRDKTVEGDNRH